MKTLMSVNTIFRTCCGDKVRGSGKILLKRFDIFVIVGIITLAILLGVLNNLRVADERKVKWFGAPADRVGPETAREAKP